MLDIAVWSALGLPLALGFLGFIEPCSIGTSLIFIKTLEDRSPAAKMVQTLVFVTTRAVFIRILGAAAAYVGSIFLQFQQSAWVLLGSIYVGLGVAYLTGYAGKLGIAIGPRLRMAKSSQGAAALAVIFGLNIPACASPLLAVSLGQAAIGGDAAIWRGFAALALFGLALSAPLAFTVLWAPARRVFDQIAAFSSRAPGVTGAVFVALGVWSMYFGLQPWFAS